VGQALSLALNQIRGQEIMSPIRIGTSGYTYTWNKGKPSPFQWYLSQGFHSVEVNASFYRFPVASWINTWLKAPQGFTFSIKVHRSITHYHKLKNRSLELWNRFRNSLEPLEKVVDFWLFQMPPNFKYSQENLEKIRNFFEQGKVGNKAVIEFRDASWWKVVQEIQDMNIVFCSLDAPKLPSSIISANDTVYLRLHGSIRWYNYVYSKRELNRIVTEVKNLNASRKVIYLNNDHGMLENGTYLLKIT